jgi:hypothetical protein
MLLADNLRAQGFVVTENADAADATLSGALTVPCFQLTRRLMPQQFW